MKNTLLFLGFVSSMLALSSCEKNDSVPDNSCTIWINGQDKSENKSLCEYRSHALTAAQVCRLEEDDITLRGATSDGVTSTGIGCKINSENENFANIDTINNRIGLRVLHVSAALYNSLFERNYQWLIMKLDTTHADFDTVAYIPNSARLAAIDTLTSLFDSSNGGWEKNYEAINEIVQNAFKFIPCTGEEFKQIKYTDQN